MVQQLLQYTKGYVRIRVTGSSYERFLNMCAKHQIELWDLLEAHNAYEMNLSIRGFKTLRPLVKKSGTKVRIIERYGLPFFLHRHRGRKALPCGVLFGVLLMMFLSGFIWDIHIEGNQARTDDVIFDFLTEQRITHGMWKSRIDCKALAADIRKAFDDIIWVSVKIQGTRLLIDVKENTDLALEEEVDYGPSDLISDVDGVVQEIITRSGTPVVKAGDTVKKGQPLVLGQVEILDDAGEVADYQYVAADADIYVKTTYSYNETFSMKYIKKEYTGRMKKGVFLTVFGKNFAFTGWPVSYEASDVVKEGHQLRVTENFYLPVTVGKIECREYEMIEKTYSKEEAVRKAKESLAKFLWKMQEKGVQILQNNVKIETGVKSCTARGEIEITRRAGKRVERTLGVDAEERIQANE